jgi:hypothetical protein
MGFDLVGIDPKNRTGEEFRNSVGLWRPLWHLVCNTTPELTDHHRFEGQHNNGMVIDGDFHGAIITSLKTILKTRPEDEVKLAIEQSPYLNYSGQMVQTPEMAVLRLGPSPQKFPHLFDWDNVKKFLKFCEKNKGFMIV